LFQVGKSNWRAWIQILSRKSLIHSNLDLDGIIQVQFEELHMMVERFQLRL
jgi:hypothetical protein